MSTTSARPVLRTMSALATGVLMLGTVLTACSVADDPDATTEPTTPAQATVTTQPASDAPAPTTPEPGNGNSDESEDAPADTCSELTGDEAVARWASDVPPNAENYPWAPAWAEPDGYDSCADLSWIILPIEGGTASSPYQIMLFHDGGYLGTATSEAYGFYPTVSRVDDATLSVTWHWPREGESSAGASGESTAQFTWDAPTSSVSMSGEVPPV
ncbi:LppP/LprE family lipoprotein [Corynebacterium glyciniphilum]|uniref:LppP/LprE family lipoprotein n=1 Tax=Corynebacterium glyciniphilum TaxID=1404244 RepID=UPI003FD29DE6